MRKDRSWGLADADDLARRRDEDRPRGRIRLLLAAGVKGTIVAPLLACNPKGGYLPFETETLTTDPTNDTNITTTTSTPDTTSTTTGTTGTDTGTPDTGTIDTGTTSLETTGTDTNEGTGTGTTTEPTGTDTGMDTEGTTGTTGAALPSPRSEEVASTPARRKSSADAPSLRTAGDPPKSR